MNNCPVYKIYGLSTQFWSKVLPLPVYQTKP